MIAEIIKHYIPRIVDLHNYIPASSVSQKLYNWETLNSTFYLTEIVKALKKLGMQVSKTDVDQIVNCVPESVERTLKVLHNKVSFY